MLWFLAGCLLFFMTIYCVIVAYFYSHQESFIYFPFQDDNGNPSHLGLQYQDVEIITQDNIKLHAWWVPAYQARGTILICHGNAGNITDRLEKISVFNRLKLNCFIFDYRGYGKSQGTPTEQGTYYDVQAVWKYLVDDGIPPEKIVVMGRSLGGAIAANSAFHNKPKALILEATFTSLPELGQRFYPYIPIKYLARIRYNTAGIISKIECPILIIHSKDDELVPLAHGKKLYDLAHAPKDFLEITGGHNDGFADNEKQYMDKLENFLSTYFDEKK